MQVDSHDLDVLAEIQSIDLAVLQMKKARAELPQRIEVMKVRKKRGEIAPKLDQVADLQAAKQAEITKVQDEDRGLAEKQQRTQDEIDASSSDYRAVEARSKDLAGIVKRRVTLEEELNRLNAEFDKIQGVRGQLESALGLCDRKEAELRASFEAQDAEIVGKARGLAGKRAELAATVAPDLMARYDETAAKAGGVALGRLEEGRCGVCRTVIEGGRLLELRSQAPLGVCPTCKRLLIIE